jgi:hypothetical protein
LIVDDNADDDISNFSVNSQELNGILTPQRLCDHDDDEDSDYSHIQLPVPPPKKKYFNTISICKQKIIIFIITFCYIDSIFH